MSKLRRMGVAAATLALLGCSSTNPPLMFGDTTSFGLRLGNDTVTAGGSVSLGYKAQSVAIVPVSVLNAEGKPELIKGHGRQYSDSMSVFAVFESKDGKSVGESPGTTVQLGQVFATGLAAQALTKGYGCREIADPSCTVVATVTAMQAAAAADKAATVANAAAASASAAALEARAAANGIAVREVPVAPSAPPATDRPYQSPLLFLRTDVVGIDIGGSLAQQGLQFVLGYTNRNVAVIPTAVAGSGGRVVKVSGGSGSNDPSSDAMSVLGQFKANTQTTHLGYGLERYFATGVAARNLSDGIAAGIAKVPLPAASAASGAN